MLEREHIDLAFVNRWSIVRTIRTQNVAEHSHLVTVYANDIAWFLQLPPALRMAVALYAPWHDKEEIFSGDLPGPNKRQLLAFPGAKKHWDSTMNEWMHRTFHDWTERAGLHGLSGDDLAIVKLVIKTADWLEASTNTATEKQLGNQCTGRHIVPNMVGALETADMLCDLLGLPNNGDDVPFPGDAEDRREMLKQAIRLSVDRAMDGQSAGPWIAREDAKRMGRVDACFAEDRDK